MVGHHATIPIDHLDPVDHLILETDVTSATRQVTMPMTVGRVVVVAVVVEDDQGMLASVSSICTDDTVRLFYGASG